MEEPPVSRQTGSYGQACMQCYRAKCRCVPIAGSKTCERCQRLRKACAPTDFVRKRNLQRHGRPVEDSRIAQLEDKVEALLSTIQSLSATSEKPASSTSERNSEKHIPNAGNSELFKSSDATHNNVGRFIGNPTPPSDSTGHDSPDVGCEPLSLEEHLNVFRSRMLPSFPFIALTDDVTPLSLQQDRPVLLQAIITVTTFSTRTKLPRIERLKSMLFTTALMETQSSMDLLQGLLTYLTWSTDLFLGGADLVSRLMMLAVSLVYDLRLFKPTQFDVQLAMTLTQGEAYDPVKDLGTETIQSYAERQRAVLACFVLSSNVAANLGRQDALRWTPQMEESLKMLEKGGLAPLDEAFAFHVRLHILRQEAAHLRERRETEVIGTMATSETSAVAGLLYLNTLRSRLQDLIASCPEQIHQRGTLMMYAHYVELYINQLANATVWGSPLLNLTGQASVTGGVPGAARFECLWRSVKSIRRWMDEYDRLEPQDLIGLPSHFWSQMIMSVTVLKYLSTLSDPEWDYGLVRNTVNLVAIIDSILRKLEEASQDVLLMNDDHLFRLLTRLLLKCRTWALSWIDVPVGGDTTSHGGSIDRAPAMVCSVSIPGPDQMAVLDHMDLASDEWLQDLLELPGILS